MRSLLVAAVGFLLSGAAWAQGAGGAIPTATGDFVKFCQQDAKRCADTIGYTYLRVNWAFYGVPDQSCVPNSVSHMQLARNVVAWIERRPERYKEHRTVVITDALATLYPAPCKLEP